MGACGELPDWSSVLHEGRREYMDMECKITKKKKKRMTERETEEGIEFTACFWKKIQPFCLIFGNIPVKE